MKRISFSGLLFTGLLLLLLAGLSSCNRGYGCPYDFSLSAEQFVETIAVLLPTM